MSNKWSHSILSEATKEELPKGVVFLGQPNLRAKIKPFLESRTFPHTLLVGMPGSGKTNLARYVAQELDTSFQEMTAPVNLQRLAVNGVTLIDEAHMQKNPEMLYKLMESSPRRTMIAATSRPEKMDDAWRSRFTLQLVLGDYSHEGMVEIGRHLIPKANKTALTVFASASGGNPRQLERIARVANDIGPNDVEKVLSTLEVTADGLTQTHLAYLRCLTNIGRPVGLTQLAALTYSGEEELRGAERLLIKLDMIELGQGGRTLTDTGERYIAMFDEM